MATALRLAATAALLGSTAFAQATFDPDIGTPIGTGADDEIISNVALGHAFAFPDGTVTNAVDIDSNGRILLPSAANASDPTPSIPELVGATAICPRWDDLTPQPTAPPASPFASPVSGIYFRTDASRTTISWIDVKKRDPVLAARFPNLFTFQCQLFASGDIALVYDQRMTADLRDVPAIAGVSDGIGFDPGESDLGPGLVTTIKTVYEFFDTNSSMWDMHGVGLLFAPNSGGGYDVTAGPAGVPAGGAERNGSPCPVSIEFFPDGTGGYFVQRTTGLFFDDGGLGTELAGPPIGLGDDANTAPQPLGFTFLWPDNTTGTDVVMDNNGRVLANGSDPSDFSPSVFELLQGPAVIAPYWTDLSSQRGSIRIFTDPNASPPFAAITWENVPKFAETQRLTFQVVLRADNSFALNYRDVSLWRTGAGLVSDDVLIGVSAGGGRMDPGPIDFAAITNRPGEPTVYEHWTAVRINGPNANEPKTPDIQTILTARSSPSVGGAMEVRMIGITAGTTSINLAIGFTNPNLDLGGFPFGLTGCTLLVDPVVTLPLARDPTDPSIADFRLGITTDPSQAGLPVIMQGINISPTESPNPLLPLVLTNAVQGTVQL